MLLAFVVLLTLTASCSREQEKSVAEPQPSSDAAETTGGDRRGSSGNEDHELSTPQPEESLSVDDATKDDEASFSQQRSRMIAEQLVARDITNERVLQSISRVPRHRFVPARTQRFAYIDSPLPIGQGQTISQPYIVALMTQLVEPEPTDRALDIGTGSGYQAAVLAEIVESVYSIEIIESLAQEAKARLQSLGYEDVQVRHGDGYRGWPDKAPFDIIIVAAAPDHVPEPLIDQLAPGGKMVIPVGDFNQDLLLIEKSKDGSVTQQKVAPVAFVPMTGKAQQ